MKVITVLAVILCGASVVDARTVAYISNADSRDIYVLELHGNDGTTTLVEKVPVGGIVMPLAISPDHKHLYAAVRSKPCSVSHFDIDPASGKLSLRETVPLVDDMAYLSTDRTGRFLFGASYNGNKFSDNALDLKGAVSAKPLQVIATGKKAHCVVTDLSNKFLFVTNLGDDAILQYRFDASSGQATPNAPPAVQTKKGAGPRHLVFHPNGRFVFGTNELDGTVNTYALAATGTLTLLASDSLVPADFHGAAPSAADLHTTPDGKFLYASERTSNTIAAFRVDGDSGKLSLIGNYPAETQPRGFNIDPEGKYLLAAGQKSNALSVYPIDQGNGTLGKPVRVEMGKNPNWVEIIHLPE